MLATFAVRQAVGGRHVGGRQDSSVDVMSPALRRRQGKRVCSLFADSGCGELHCMLIADRRTEVPELAAFRIDFNEWLSGFTRRDQRIIAALASGERGGIVAQRFGISDGRVTQLRRKYE